MDDAGYGNATNAEEHNSQNQSGILFPIAEEISQTETDLIAMIKTTGKNKNYELIEYISNVNTQYTQVLMELNENGAMDAAYTYGVSRLTEDRFTGESNFYLYDPAGNVAGITDQDGYLWQSYRYDAFGNATFGSPQYDNEYTFNGESYNPNIHSQYLRARYYDTVKGSFLAEDSYLGDITNPLTLNRYSYCIGNPLFYSDPSGHWPTQKELNEILVHVYGEEGKNRIADPNANATAIIEKRTEQEKEYNKFVRHLDALQYLNSPDANVKHVLEYDYSTANAEKQNAFDNLLGKAAYKKYKEDCDEYEIDKNFRTFEKWLHLYNTPTVEGKGRLVSIPEDRPREAGEYWGDEWAAPSWKSEEAKYTEDSMYINSEAYGIVHKMGLVPEVREDINMMMTEVKGIDRYWVAVGPRVMVENYPFTDGQEIAASEMKYGTCIDIILRDSNYNTYFVPAIVGDIKEHTLDSEYGKRVDDDGKDISKKINSSAELTNGVYQTGYSWVDRELAKEYKDKEDKPNGAMVEFIRPLDTKDQLLRTPEFDILGMIVYD